MLKIYMQTSKEKCLLERNVRLKEFLKILFSQNFLHNRIYYRVNDQDKTKSSLTFLVKLA